MHKEINRPTTAIGLVKLPQHKENRERCRVAERKERKKKVSLD